MHNFAHHVFILKISFLIIIILIKGVVVLVTIEVVVLVPVVLLLVHEGPEVADQHSPSSILIASVHNPDCFVFVFLTI